MAYIEKRKYVDKEYGLLTVKFGLLGKSYKVSTSLGKYHDKLNISSAILNNLDFFQTKIYNIRKNFLPELRYKQKSLEDAEKLAIRLSLLIEAKKAKEMILTEFAKEFIFNSNNIEGSKIPKEEVNKIIDNGESAYYNRNEVIEVFNSIKAMNYIENHFQFNVSSIKRLYYVLTIGLKGEDGMKYPRGFKTKNIVVNNQKTTSPDKVEIELNNMIRFYRKYKKNIHPLILAFEMHAMYERIHPFTDANGRTGRLIMNKILMANNYFPLIIYKENMRSYHNSLKSYIIDGKQNKYYEFMTRQLLKTYKQFILFFD